MRKKRIKAIVATGLTLAIAINAWSGDAGKGNDSQEKIFNILDANSDGKVTEKEFVITGLHEIFVSFDLDGSGKVSKKEFLKATAKHKIDHDAEWTAMSRGSDEITFKQSLRNKVAVEEMQGHFKKLDKKGKGFVTMNDLR